MGIEDYTRIPGELMRRVDEAVRDARARSGMKAREVLGRLGVSASGYYRWRGRKRPPPRRGLLPPVHSVLPEERDAVIEYALRHPNHRHRELAWRMVDEDIVCLSPSSVYRILKESDLVHAWLPKRKKRYRDTDEKATRPDERWQSDIRYVKVGRRDYYLVLFIDEYSRYVVHHELLRWMDGDTLSMEAQRAIEKLPEGAKPCIQTDNGSGYVSREFHITLGASGVGHVRIHPHCPEENGLVERAHRTLGEMLDAYEVGSYDEARERISGIVRYYNTERLHSGVSFLRPADMYRGEPEKLLEERGRKLRLARHRRREANLGLRQSTLALDAARN
jgi:putative transposase